jgi:hypothetical protein
VTQANPHPDRKNPKPDATINDEADKMSEGDKNRQLAAELLTTYLTDPIDLIERVEGAKRGKWHLWFR